MADEREITTVFRADISNFTAATQQLNRNVAQINSEFKNSVASMSKWNDNTDGLNAKIKQLNGVLDAEKKRLSMLEDEYDKLKAAGKENTAEAQNLATAINNQSAKVKETERSIEHYTASLKELENAGVKTRQELEELNNTADAQGSKFKAIGGTLARGAAVGIAGIATAAVGAVGSFLALGESTREVRENFSRLETAFTQTGLSAKNAQDTYNELYGILGDTGRATEAAQQLAQFSKTEDDLIKNTQILSGVMSVYGDSIPTEGLAEGMAASAAMGEVQGVLADALEWQGVNLEKYNKELATMATEEERAAYIQGTLIDLYGESAKAFEEQNKDIIAAREAEAELTKVTAELGAVAEPILTTLKTLAADLLTAIAPFVKLIGEGLSGALAGTAGATDTLAEGINGVISTLLTKAVEILPSLINVISALLPMIVTTILEMLPQLVNTLSILIVQVLNAISGMLPTLIPVIIGALLMIVETIINNLDLIIDAAINVIMALADGLLAALPQLIDKVPVIIDKLLTALSNNLPKLIECGIQLTLKLAAGLIKAIPQLLEKIPQLVTSFIKAFSNYYSKLGDIGLNMLKGIWDGIKDGASWLKDKIKGFADNVAGWFKDALKINSPSKLMEDEIGRFIGEGIGVGIVDSEKAVKKDISHFNKALINGLSSANVDITAGVNFDNESLNIVGNAGRVATADNNASLLNTIIDKLNANNGGTKVINNTINNTFEKMETSRLALHKSNLENKRILGGLA